MGGGGERDPRVAKWSRRSDGAYSPLNVSMVASVVSASRASISPASSSKSKTYDTGKRVRCRQACGKHEGPDRAGGRGDSGKLWRGADSQLFRIVGVGIRPGDFGPFSLA